MISPIIKDSKSANFVRYNVFSKFASKILEENKNITSFSREISIDNFKSYISKQEILFHTLRKLMFVIENLEESIKKLNLKKRYLAKEVLNFLNSRLKVDGLKEVASSTVRTYITILKSLGLITVFWKPKGEGNGSEIRYITNKKTWDLKHKYLKIYFEEKIKNFVVDKKIVHNFNKETKYIESCKFINTYSGDVCSGDLNNQLINHTKNSRSSNFINSEKINEKLISEEMENKLENKNKFFVKNFKKIESFKNKEKEIIDHDTEKKFEKNLVENHKKNQLKIDTEIYSVKKFEFINEIYDKDLKEKVKNYQFLKKNYQISNEIIIKVKEFFKENIKSFKNCLLNLKDILLDLEKKGGFKKDQIISFYLEKIENKYFNKIHLLSKFHAKKGLKSDYFDFIEEFKKKIIESKLKIEEKKKQEEKILDLEFLSMVLRENIQKDKKFSTEVYSPDFVLKVIDEKYLNKFPKLTKSLFEKQFNSIVSYLKEEILNG